MARTGYGRYGHAVASSSPRRDVPRSPSRRRAATVALAFALGLTACGSGDGGSSETAATVGTGSSGPAGVPAALDFTAPLVGGGTFDGAALAGRPVAFWFWAPT